MVEIHRLILATKIHKDTRRKENNQKLLQGGPGGRFSRKESPWPPEAKIGLRDYQDYQCLLSLQLFFFMLKYTLILFKINP
jgi:hypothetical protein